MGKSKTLYLMCGLAFSGKSTLAREIASRTGTPIISLDDINAERDLHGGDGIADHEWVATHKIALQRLDAMASKAQEIIIDDTNCLRWLRDNYRNAAARHGYVTVVIFLDVPLETIRQRASENMANRTRKGVLPSVMEELINKFEYPVKGEEEILVFTPAQRLSEWLEENFE